MPIAWHVVETHPQEEQKANYNLRRQNFETFLPLFGRLVATKKGARKVNLRALFPGYMFVQFDANITPWSCINSTFGAKRILMTGGAPGRISDSVMDSIRSRVDKFGVMLEDRFAEWYGLVNKRLLIQEGAFAGHSGMCVYADADRVKILLAILGRDTVIILPRAQAVVAD